MPNGPHWEDYPPWSGAETWHSGECARRPARIPDRVFAIEPGTAGGGRLGRMTAPAEQPAWTITMPPAHTTSGAVEVVLSGALDLTAHALFCDTLRMALVAAASATPGTLRVDLTAVTALDRMLLGELVGLAETCAAQDIRLGIDVPPPLRTQLDVAELAPVVRFPAVAVADVPEPVLAVDITATWLDQATLVLAVAGDLDAATAPRMRDEVAVILAARPLRVVLDLTGVRFLSSAGVTELVRLAHSAVDDAITLHLAAGEHARQVFDLLGLSSTVLRVFPTREDALDGFAA
jgi:anti-sigma B factor antagonist